MLRRGDRRAQHVPRLEIKQAMFRALRPPRTGGLPSHLEFVSNQRYPAIMLTLKSALTALLLFSILPLCNLAAASAGTHGVADTAFSSDEASVLPEADPTEPRIVAPAKAKRIGILHEASCGTNGLMPAAAGDLLIFSRDVKLAVGTQFFYLSKAQAPPTSPPRSI